MDDLVDSRLVAIRRFLFVGSMLVLIAWSLAGQWDLATPGTRAWLQFTGVACLSSLILLPGSSESLSAFRARAQWCGRVVVVGLVVTS